MIGHLKGMIDFIDTDHIIIDVQGVGYTTYMPMTVLSRMELEKEIKVFTYLHVREDTMQLYGFLKKIDLEVFKMLLGVSGVGPKVGLAILSQCSCEEIISGIDLERPEVFTKVTGIGKKTAQRILLDLKGKTKNLPILPVEQPIALTTESNLQGNNVIDEALSGLISLGYNSKEITGLVYDIVREFNGNITVEELLNKSLKKLASSGR